MINKLYSYYFSFLFSIIKKIYTLKKKKKLSLILFLLLLLLV
jgi:hypothetical protein